MAPNVTKVSDLRGNKRPIDPDVLIPEAVRRATERAEAAHKTAYQAENPEPAPTPAPTGDTVQIAPDASTPPTPPSPPVTQQGNEPAPPQPAPTPPVEEDWQQKYRSAEGRRAALQNQLVTATDRITALEHMVFEMQQSAPPVAPSAPVPAPQALITEQERNEFGAEMLDVMGRRALESVSPEVQALKDKIAQLEGKLTNTVATTTKNARDTMLQKLDEAVPEWKGINMRPEFKAWLALPDPYFGVSRHSALLSAFEKNDTPRVLNFFKGFVSELAAQAPDQNLPAEVPPAAPQPARPSLENLAAPGRARTSAQPGAPAEKQIITTADISAFYAAVRRGEYTGRDAERAQLEAELFAAQREGRVRAA